MNFDNLGKSLVPTLVWSISPRYCRVASIQEDLGRIQEDLGSLKKIHTAACSFCFSRESTTTGHDFGKYH
jgi:hypothetical protein